MSGASPVRRAVAGAIEQVQRYGLPLTPENVRANIHVGGFTLDDLEAALKAQITVLIPVMMKEQGMVITNAATRERKPFWDTVTGELDAQLRIKEEGAGYDLNRLLADKAVVAFLREKEQELGYEVCPGLFHDEVQRIYAMNGIKVPGNGTERAGGAS